MNTQAHHDRSTAKGRAGFTSQMGAIALALSVGACGANADWGDTDALSDSELGGLGQAIKNGTFVGTKGGLVEISTDFGSCTGALLNRHWLLTAGHCLDRAMTSRHGKVALTVRHFTSTKPVQISGSLEEMDAFIIDTWDCFHRPPGTCKDWQDDLAIVKRETPWQGTTSAHYFRINGGLVGGSITDIGQIEFFGRGAFSDDGTGFGTLRKTPITPNDWSKHWFSDLEGSRAICLGDSGGPYIGKRPIDGGTGMIEVIAGVSSAIEATSLRSVCTKDGGTQYAARTNSRVDWIASKMRLMNDDIDVCGKLAHYTKCF